MQTNQTKIAKKVYTKYEINAMDSIFKAMDKFEALGLKTDNLKMALYQIQGSLLNVTK